MHFFNGIAIVVSRLVELLPVFDGYPDGVYSAFTAMAGYWGMFDLLIPMATVTTVLTFIIGVELVFLGYRVVMKLISLIPTMSKH